jgi:DNA-binding transcriptional MerR regulator
VVELVKLYYRIGEVAQIVGVQPHVLRYWETEFRTIRPQKSGKGQRVYSRKDVEKLLRVKDLLKNQGFTIAGAKKKLREPGEAIEANLAPALAPAPDVVEERALQPERFLAPVLTPLAQPRAPTPAAPASVSLPVAPPAAGGQRERVAQARMRDALLSIREEMVAMLGELDRPPARRPKLPSIG